MINDLLEMRSIRYSEIIPLAVMGVAAAAPQSPLRPATWEGLVGMLGSIGGGCGWLARVRQRLWRVGGGVGVALVAAVLAWSMLFGQPANVAAGTAATVATDVLSLRAAPGLWAPVISQLAWGYRVDIYWGPSDDGWYEIQFGDQHGYVYGAYLEIDGANGWSDGPLGGWVEPYVAWVDTDQLNVRALPDLNSGVRDWLYWGDEVTVTGRAVDGYLPIDHWGGRAWVWAGYLSFDGPPGPERWIDVDRSSGMVTLYEGDWAVASYWGAMGWDQSDDGFFATANGTYYVYAKEAGLTWTDWGQVFIRDFVAFDPYRANGFHTYSLDWQGSVLPMGANPTGGCIALEPWAADQLFTFARLGTRVEIHW